MDKNLTKFLKDLDKEVEDCLDDMDNKIKGTIEKVHESLFRPKSLSGTPVQTGHLRSNWIVSLDSKYDGVVGSRKNVDTTTQDSKWIEFLNIKQLYLHDVIYFNNNVWYGPIVNAKQGFRTVAIQNGDQWLKANRK